MPVKITVVNRTIQKIETFADICRNVASLSYDTKYKVGSIIFDSKFREIYSMGYNGNYAGGPNERDSMGSGDSGFIHAELNALLKFDKKASAADIIMCTMTPCWHCAKCIANSGLKKAVFLTNYAKDRRFETIFKDADIDWVVLDDCADDDIMNIVL